MNEFSFLFCYYGLIYFEGLFICSVDAKHVSKYIQKQKRISCFIILNLDWQENGGVVLKRENPHKYLLYKPTVSQFLVFLASGHKELPPNGALMIYISGDGCFSTKPQPEDPR